MDKDFKFYVGQKIYYIGDYKIQYFWIKKVGRKYLYISGGQYYWRDVIEKSELLEHLKKEKCVNKKFSFSLEEMEEINNLGYKVHDLNIKLRKMNTNNLTVSKVEALLCLLEGVVE